MNMDKKALINSGDVKGLSLCTFEQTLPAHMRGEKESTFTEPLSEEEEVLLVAKFCENPDVWSDFIKNYIKHYTFCNKAIHLLIEHFDVCGVAHIVDAIFARYGYTADDIVLLSKQKCDEIKRTLIFKTVSENVRVFDKTIYQILEKHDLMTGANFAETYRKNVPSFR